MKWVKKIVSILLVITVLGATLTINGCSKYSSSSIQFGEWIKMIDETFGMEMYQDKTPHIKGISEDNVYFEYIQIASEWEVIDDSMNIDTGESLLWEDAIETLVNAGGFMSNDATKEEKINYGITTFDKSIRKYALQWEIPLEQAEKLLDIAYKTFADKKYLVTVEKVKYSDDIVDLTDSNNCVKDYVISSNAIKIPASQAKEITEGKIFVLPPNNKVMGVNAYKAVSVKTEGENTIIQVSNEDIEIEDIAENLEIKSTFVPTAENTVIYDGNGKLISYGSEIVSTDLSKENYTPKVSYLGDLNGAYDTNSTASGNVSTEFNIDGWKVKLKYNLNGEFNLTGSVEKILKESSTKDSNASFGAELSLDKFEITNDVEIEWFKLKHAELKVDYETKLSFTGKYSNKKEGNFGPYNNGNGKYLTNVKKAFLKDHNAQGAHTVKICSLTVYGTPLARVCLDVNLKISFEGSISIVVTEHGSKGFEYKNGNLRNIKVSDKDVDVTIKAKIEGTLGIGPALYVIGLKKKIVGFQVAVGIGVEVSITMHLVDSMNHLLETASGDGMNLEMCDSFINATIEVSQDIIRDIALSQGATYEVEKSNNQAHFDCCFDVSAYFILRLEFTDESLLGDLIGGKIKTSIEIFGSKNGKFLNLHMEKLDWSQLSNIKFGTAANESQCTKKFTPFEEDDKEDAESTTTNENFAVDSYSMDLVVGDSEKVNITNLPSKYKRDDVSFVSEDKSVAIVETDGTVKAVSEGTTTIRVVTKDGKYKYDCLVMVTEK